MRVRLSMTVAALMLLAACGTTQGGGAPATSTTSTLTGVVLATPGCPGPVHIDSPCPDKPVDGATVEVMSAATKVATTTTGADGRFSVQVAPGRYTVVAFNVGYHSQASQDVDLSASADITLVVDSGMR